MISITRNLDELFDYTQGLIRELQQKNNEIIVRSETKKTATSPALSSLQQLRDDTLKYKAWQKQSVYEAVDDSLTEDMMRVNKLERQWENQKNESQRLALSSILNGCNPRVSRSNSKNSLQAYPDRSYQRYENVDQSLSYAIDTSYYHAGAKKSDEKRTLSVQKSRSDKTYLNDNSMIGRYQAPRQSFTATESKTRTLKPSKSLTEISGGQRFRTPEPSRLKKDSSASKFNDIKRFLRNSLYDSNKSSNSRENSLRHVQSYTIADIKETKQNQNRDKSLPIGVKIDLEEDYNNDEEEEISEIVPEEQFEIDTEAMDTEIQLFSKKSSIAANDVYHRQGWILEEALKEEFTAQYNNQPARLLDKMAHTDATRSYLNFNQKPTTAPWTDGKQLNDYAKTPIRNNSKPFKAYEVSNFSAAPAEAKSASKYWQAKNQESVSKWLKSRSNQKENQQMRNNEVSVYDNIISSKAQSGTKKPLEYTKKAFAKQYERSTSVKKNPPQRNVVEVSNKSAQKPQPNLNEGDRLYNEILEKLNKEKLLKANKV